MVCEDKKKKDNKNMIYVPIQNIFKNIIYTYTIYRT